MARTETNTENNTKTREHQDATDIQKKTLKKPIFFKISKMISPRNVVLPPWYGHCLSNRI